MAAGYFHNGNEFLHRNSPLYTCHLYIYTTCWVDKKIASMNNPSRLFIWIYLQVKHRWYDFHTGRRDGLPSIWTRLYMYIIIDSCRKTASAWLVSCLKLSFWLWCSLCLGLGNRWNQWSHGHFHQLWSQPRLVHGRLRVWDQWHHNGWSDQAAVLWWKIWSKDNLLFYWLVELIPRALT